MKLKSFLLPALASLATASAEEQPQNAEAYIIRQSKTTTSTNPPSLPNDLARAILLQRLSTPEQPSALGQLPDSLPEHEAISYINQFGKQPRPLFEEPENDADEPSQLVIAFSGITTDKYKDLKAAVSRVPLAFTAHKLSRLPARGMKSSCAFEASINPENTKCFKGKTQYLEYDVTKDSSVVTQLRKNLESLTSQARSGKLETTILLLAPTSAPSESEELRRRNVDETEQVLAAKDSDDSSLSSSPESNVVFDTKPVHAFASRPAPILPSCFSSYNACVTATDSCSGHGQCIDKWAKSSADGADSCFFCHCLATNEADSKGPKGFYRWGGSACHKRDISTPFWMFAGVTIGLVATIAFAIGLLFSVGEEKLPGVIGAGVSRSK
ncbi:hypothetical protein AAE478_009822 [Parahypoxylon ruwenzoriense]